MDFCLNLSGTISSLLVNIVIFAIGTAILVKGSDLFVDSAAALARIWKVPELVIGLTLVSIGTSLPELASSVYASCRCCSDFTIGNIIGSNVTNIALILGIGIIGAGALPFQKKMVMRDGTVMIIVYAVTCLMFLLTRIPYGKSGMVHGLNYIDGILLLILCGVYTWMLFRQNPEENTAEGNTGKSSSVLKQLGFVAVGILMITAGSKAMVDPVVWCAQKMGISMLVISATIVAFGTSVPELAVTIAGVIKKQHDIAYGNIIGSNIFNILLIFGVTSCINPLHLVFDGIGLFNLISMIVVALVLLGMMLASKKQQLTKVHGFILVAMYAVYLVWNCRDAICR